MTAATPSQVNEFVATVDKFMADYARLTLPSTKEAAYSSGDPALIADYNSAVSRGAILKTAITSTVGAWNTFKSAWGNFTDGTSMVIGDAIDTVRSWFGYNPSAGLNGLGAFQLPAAVWIVGIIASASVLLKFMNSIFVRIEASRIQRDNPGTSRERALQLAQSAHSLLPSSTSAILVGSVALLAWLYLGSR